MNSRIILPAVVMLAASSFPVFAQHDGSIPFPTEFRNWYQHHTTVNLKGHTPEGEVGIQNVYVNAAARAGLRTGNFEDGAVFVVDRFSYKDEGNDTLKQDKRKVVAVMLRDRARYSKTGGWGFQGFKGGDPNAPVVKDGGAECFTCHVPHADNNFLFTRGE